MSEGNDKSKKVSTKTVAKAVSAVKACIRENEAAIAELTQERDKYKELWEAAEDYIDQTPNDPSIFGNQLAAMDRLVIICNKYGV